MTTGTREKQARPSKVIRFIQILTLWRHMKVLTMFGAALGIMAFCQQNPSPFVVFPGVLVSVVLAAGAVCQLVYGDAS